MTQTHLVLGMIMCVSRFLSKQNNTDNQKSIADEQFHGQFTAIVQNQQPFHSPYIGPNSFLSRSQTDLSDTYTFYFGRRLSRSVEFYFNPEMARGGGLSDALGLAGYSNGDVIRNPSLSQEAYAGRYFLRYTTPTGHGNEHIDDAPNQIAGDVPLHRLVVTGGKLGTNDLFDTNRYANNTRTQFMNWDLINNAAYDYAADTRGYSLGVAVEWINPEYSVRLGSFQMPKVANGIDLDGDVLHTRGDQVELELHPNALPTHQASTLRLLYFRNVARMGDYRESLATTAKSGTTPDITSTRRDGRVKYGFGASFEQPLADHGETGLFARLGWNDGSTESFAYTEAEQSLSLGLQVAGTHWKCPKDLLSIAIAQNGLSGPHRDYLEAGGMGFILGDGRLKYGPEQIVECYYNHPIGRGLVLGVDLQIIQNPGYNQDRGPVPLVSGRVHYEF